MSHPKEERTLIIMKPDTLQRSLVGQIIHRFERKGLRIIGMKMMRLEDVMLEEHYAHIKDKPFFVGIKNYMKSSPVVVMALSGINTVSATRLIVGPTKAYEADAGSIRGDFSLSMQSNIVHASDSLENAESEVKRFFTDEELFEYEKMILRIFTPMKCSD
jgi:nucleoside-diphosphate kinase